MSRITEHQELKQVLSALGLSQAWAAKQIGITPTYMGLILTGKAKPSAALNAKLVSLQDKLQGSGLRAV